LGLHLAVAKEKPEASSSKITIDREELGRRLDAFLEPLVAKDQLSGRLLVRIGDEAPLVREFGWANAELQVPVGPDTAFNVASITKPMTVIALLGLIENKALAPDDPISKWLPDFPRGDEITVEMLRRHRSGIPHRVTEERDESVPRTTADMARLAAAKPLTFEPGERESYSSAGYSVLTRVMELASGSSYQQLLGRYVAKPAGMKLCRHADARELLPGRAESYLIGITGEMINAPLKDLSFLVGAGSVWTTAEDLDRMVRCLRDGAYSDKAQENLLHPSGFHSNGLTSGFRAFADWHREQDLTVILTANLITGAADLVRDAVPKLAAGDEVPPPEVPDLTAVAVDQADLQKLEGSYQLREGRNLNVHAIPGGLMIGTWVLIPRGRLTFVSPQDYATIQFTLDEEGKPTKLTWINGERKTEMPRT
jgi:CubicO group peptidase (beta-lactamase class C family)